MSLDGGEMDELELDALMDSVTDEQLSVELSGDEFRALRGRLQAAESAVAEWKDKHREAWELAVSEAKDGDRHLRELREAEAELQSWRDDSFMERYLALERVREAAEFLVSPGPKAAIDLTSTLRAALAALEPKDTNR
jgi:hypothetical protein